MSLTSSLSNAMSGLKTSSRLAEIASSNLANASTDGYGVRRLDLSSQSLGGRGAGVQIDGITRLADRGMIADRRLADAALANGDAIAKTLIRVETLVGAADDPASLQARLAALEQALVTASSDPASDVRLGAVVQRLEGFTGALNASAAGLRDLRQAADVSIGDQVDLLNTSLRMIEQLNDDIQIVRSRGQDALGLIDQRQVIVDRIATIVPIRELDRPNGAIALMTTRGAMLVDGPAAQFGFSSATYVVPEMTLASGALSGLTRNGVSVDPANGIGKLVGGSLGAAFFLRDNALVSVQAGLDSVARDLISRFQNPATDPTLAIGDAGLFTDGSAAITPPAIGAAVGSFDPANTVGISGRIAVNVNVDPARGGDLSRLRDGLHRVAPLAVGDAQQIERWMDTLAAPSALSTGGSALSAAGHMSRLASGIGTTRLSADDSVSFATARWSTLREAELAGGVDSDAEMTMLMRVEQAYAANARVIQTIQAMFDKLMEI